MLVRRGERYRLRHHVHGECDDVAPLGRTRSHARRSPVVRQRKTMQPLRLIRDLPHRAVVARRVNMCHSTVIGEEIDGARFGAPLGLGRIAVQRPAQDARPTAIRVHDPQLPNGVALLFFLGEEVRDAAAVGRWNQRLVDTLVSC